MAITNHERVGNVMDLLKEGLAPFIEREFISVYKKAALDEAKRFVADDRLNTNRPLKEWDAAPLLRQGRDYKMVELIGIEPTTS